MYKFTYPSELFDEKKINTQMVTNLINQHQLFVPRFFRNADYYMGNHRFAERNKGENAPNNRIICNHARYVADIATGYFLGNPLSYKSGEDLTELNSILKIAEAEKADYNNALNMSKFGLSYEFLYAKEGTNDIVIKSLSPMNTFIVTDDSIEEKPLFAVYYYVKENSVTGNKKYSATVLTKNYRLDYDLSQTGKADKLKAETEHNFGDIPIVEYKNNEDVIGDYEQVISLIDAYNILMSDRVNDKEQFVDSILVLYGMITADTREGASQFAEELRKNKLLEMSEDARVEYLTHTLDENGVEVLRKALEQDIHKFSYVPCLSDECFSGNSSGVAIEYKLLAMEMATKIKERNYKSSVGKRLELIGNYYKALSHSLNLEDVEVVFTRGLPKNLVEIAQVVSMLQNSVSNKTLLGQLPFVKNVDDEIKQLDEEKENSITENNYFAKTDFSDLDENEEKDESEDDDE